MLLPHIYNFNQYHIKYDLNSQYYYPIRIMVCEPKSTTYECDTAKYPYLIFLMTNQSITM